MRSRRAEEALATFPLPQAGKTSQENYRAILEWLYSPTLIYNPYSTVSHLIIALSKEKPR